MLPCAQAKRRSCVQMERIRCENARYSVPCAASAFIRTPQREVFQNAMAGVYEAGNRYEQIVNLFEIMIKVYFKKEVYVMNEVQVFNNPEFGKVRTVAVEGTPYFVGKDVAEILGYSNPRDALSKHVDAEDKGVAKCDTLGGSQGALAKAGAQKIMVEYADCKPIGVTFALYREPFGLQGFTLPAAVDGTLRVFAKQKVKTDREQAERTAWRNVRDWVLAQMALIESCDVPIDEVFLPYLTSRSGQTLYQIYSSGQLMLERE